MIGLDIGGANTKAAVVGGDGDTRVVSEPFELWRDPEGVPGAIASVVERLDLAGAPVALTTTAELVDAFASKREGVLHMLDAAERALPGRRLRVITTGGELIGLRPRDASHQVADRAQRQAELPGNVRSAGSEPCHASQSQPYVGIRRARH